MRSNPPSNWTRVTLADAVSLRRGLDLPVKDRAGGPVPVVGASGPVGHHNTAVVEGPSFTIGRSASIGHLTWVDNDFWPLNTTLYVTDPNGNNLRFLYYALHTVDFDAYNSGSVQPMLNRNYVANHPIVLPPRVEQDAVAEVLGALDDRIDLLKRQATTLQEVGDALFGKHASDVVKLRQVAKTTMGQAPPGSSYNELPIGLPLFQGSKDFGFRYPTPQVWCVDPRRVADPGHVLVSVRAPVGALNVAAERCVIGRGVAALASEYPSTLLYALRRVAQAWRVHDSAGTVFGSITKAGLHQVDLLWPGRNGEGLEDQLANLDAKIANAHIQQQTLADLRDTLLPRLVSGELRITDAERLVGEAV